MPDAFKLKDSAEKTTGANPRHAPKWYARGYATSAEAISAVDTAVGAAGETTIDGMVVRNRTPRLITINPGGTVTRDWEVSLEYATPSFGETEATMSFDITGGSIHMTQSRETVSAQAIGGATLYDDLHGAIGWNKETNQVQGVDVSDGGAGVGFTLNRVFPKSYLVGASPTVTVAQIAALKWRTNSSTFFGASAGQMRFIGCSGSLQNDNQWHLAYKFLWDTQATQAINDVTVTIPPHHYMWVCYEMKVVGAHKLMVPVEVLVERLFDSGDFSVLGLS